MKYLLCAVLLWGCEDKGRVKGNDVKHDLAKAVNTTAEYAKENVQETRDDAVAATQKQLDAMNSKIADLKADVAKRNDAAKAQAQQSLADLDAKRAELQKSLDQMKADTEQGWKETRRKVNAVADAFDASFKDLKARLDKI